MACGGRTDEIRTVAAGAAKEECRSLRPERSSSTATTPPGGGLRRLLTGLLCVCLSGPCGSGWRQTDAVSLLQVVFALDAILLLDDLAYEALKELHNAYDQLAKLMYT